ncbi:spore germination protein [Robertmurraya massiliosenegalensis]|uniref:spore germination protein n=1 Tax=Robertmurraya massiliosenegalensis TaxID=1287657 RepID=UPI00030D9AEB|nr:spore germination protein [Robertmurraya massiliosenegalensis]
MSLSDFLFKRRKNKNGDKAPVEEIFQKGDVSKEYYRSLSKNKKAIQELFKNTFDFSCDDIKLGELNACVCYLGTMLSVDSLTNKVLNVPREPSVSTKPKNIEAIRDHYFPTLAFEYADTFHRVVWHVLNGFAVIMVEGQGKALSLEIGNIEKRAITEPSTQTIIRGPKEAFTEDINTNISLIRKRIKNPYLTFEGFYIGRDTKTTVGIGYVSTIANADILAEVRQRIKKIDVGGILDSGNIEELIVDKSFTPFPLVFNTERPDSICGHLLEGKIALIVDGSPFVLAVPSVLTDFFQSSEDYYQPFLMSSFIRIIRYMSFMIALVLPSLYVALSTFHQELMPTQLLISIQAQREGVPFPAVIEIFMMELTFEIMREAGVRMPRAVGQTVSIVGALVIGQAAVEAGLVSNVLVIIVAFTAIASFVSPIYNFSISTRLLRFVLILCAAIFGLYGVLLFLIIMVIHLVSLRSLGVPYLAPVAPFKLFDQDDVFLRMPIWANKKRPSYLFPESPMKKKGSHKPSPPPAKGGGK